MQQTVAILLNEREPQKKEIADALEAELKEEGITSSRISSSPKLGEEIIAARPSILVIDYILEDYGTGLDLLEHCRSQELIHRPTCIFLTDEPSLQVAIAAMKLGASDYLLTTDVHALSECVSFIKSNVAKTKQIGEYRKQLRRARGKKELVLTSDTMIAVLESLRAELQKSPEVIVLCGENGVGKKTIARLLIHEQKKLPLSIEVEKECASFSSIMGRAIDTFESFEGPSTQASLLLENLSLSTIDLAEAVSSELSTITQRLSSNPFPIFVTTSDIRVAKAFSTHFQSFTSTIPSLKEGRESEISQLVQKFLFEAATTYKVEVPKLTAKELGWFSKQNWDENISQLKRVIDTFAAAGNIISGETKQEKLNRIIEIDSSTRCVNAELEELRASPLSLLETFIQAGGDLSSCARFLGCSVANVYELMQQTREIS